MSNKIDWIPSSKEESINGDTDVYSFDYIKDNFKYKELIRNGLLVLKQKEDYWLDFAVLEFHCSNSDDTSKMYSMIFYGSGTLGALRECRHTYWGEEGYLFYPDGKLITAAFLELSEYFDDLK